MMRASTLMLLALATAACFAAVPPQKAKKPASTATPNAAQKPAAKTISRTAKGRSSAKANPAMKVKNVRYVRRHGKLVRISSSSAATSYQLHPDPERYQQIQQALTDKGYFKGEINGQWGDDSVDALRRFQTDQKLDGDGHLTALSLSSLGLGPKHDTDTSIKPASAPTPVPNNSAPANAPPPTLAPVSNSAVAVPVVKPPDQQIEY